MKPLWVAMKVSDWDNWKGKINAQGKMCKKKKKNPTDSYGK